MNVLSAAINTNDVGAIRKLLQETVNGYEPSSGVVDWVQLAEKTKIRSVA